jgi:hypothetical protein
VDVTAHLGRDRFQATTEADGTFRLEQLPAGGLVRLSMAKSGYHPAELSVFLDDAAGEYPAGSAYTFAGSVALLPHGQTPWGVRVLFYNGQPVPEARVLLDLPVGFAVQGEDEEFVPRGSIRTEALTDVSGTAHVPQMPDTAVLASQFPDLALGVAVPAYVSDNGQTVAQGIIEHVALSDLLMNSMPITLVLPPSNGGDDLHIIASTLPDLVNGQAALYPGMVAPSDEIFESLLRVVFSVPVALGTLTAILVAEDGLPLNPNGTLTQLLAAGTLTDGGFPNATDVLDLVLPRVPEGTATHLFLHVAPTGNGLALDTTAPVYFHQSDPLAVLKAHQLNSVSTDGVLGPLEDLELVLNQAVGGRFPNGMRADATSFLPTEVTLTQPGITVKARAVLAEPEPGQPYALGGFTTRLRIRMPLDPPAGGFSSEIMTVQLEFNDAVVRDGGSSQTGALVTVTPWGVPAGTVSSSPVLQLLDSEL